MVKNELYFAGDYIVTPKIYNELSPGNIGSKSAGATGAIELGRTLKFMLEGDFNSYQYSHNANQASTLCTAGAPGCNTINSSGQYQTGVCPTAGDPGCVTAIGYQGLQKTAGLGQEYVNALTALETDFDAHAGIKVLDPRIYVGAGYYSKSYNYLGYPNLSGFGVGVSKLPDLDQGVSVYGGAWYYPSVTGNYTYPTSTFLGTLSGRTVPLGYSVLKYNAGVTLDLGPVLFVKLGYGAEYASAKTNAPANTSLSGATAGLGVRL